MSDGDEKQVLALACEWRAVDPDYRLALLVRFDTLALSLDDIEEANAARVASELLKALGSS